MKIKTKTLSYKEVLALPKERRRKPKKPSMLFRLLLKILSAGDLRATDFSLETEGMERLGKQEPALFLMNHSSFIDLKIASEVLFPRPFNIICTSDGFVGKGWLMRHLGCIPTNKFTTDIALVKDMLYTVGRLRSSILMYPEASYTFDGTATPLPGSIGPLLKKLNVPLIMIKTSGAFHRDPLYNMLQLREVKVTARMSYVLSPEEIREKSNEELNAIVAGLFTFDNFRWQQENYIKITESFRADGLNRVLYKCPGCRTEGFMQGKGISLGCGSCGRRWTLTEEGFIKAEEGDDEFTHIPDWYAWERREVKNEIQTGRYLLDIPVKISVLADAKYLYNVGEGRLIHDNSGFRLTGCDGTLSVSVPPLATYSLYADYFWYEIGDVICIGSGGLLYYCFPQDAGDVVAKTRLATEELYKEAVKAISK